MRSRLFQYFLVLSLLDQCQCYYIVTPLTFRVVDVHPAVRIRRFFPRVSSTSNGEDYFEKETEIDDCLVKDQEENEYSSSSSISESGNIAISRRVALGSLAAIGGSISTSPSLSAAHAGAIEQQQEQAVQEQSAALFNIKCLADLPPIPEGFVRVYLCRHGQTENNRLNLMQGARVDPAINDTGMAQAQRLGLALTNVNNADGAVPDLILHSKLLRARQTAKVASVQFTNQQQQRRVVPKLATLDSLGEVDFGEIAEGLPVEQVRSQLIATYAGWATGNLDMGMPGGETGRQVLCRVENALNTLVQQATSRARRSSSKCAVAAVTHSTYLRMLLAVAQEQPLLLASTMEQKNGCINVVDIRTDGSTKLIGPNSRLFTTAPGKGAPADFGLTIPVCQVVRINEKRHLGGLV